MFYNFLLMENKTDGFYQRVFGQGSYKQSQDTTTWTIQRQWGKGPGIKEKI